MHLLTQAKNSVSALELKRHLGVRYKCAWLMKHTLLQVMAEREENRELDGRVEIDDAYLGGALPGGKRGRGSQNKVSFIAAVQTTEKTGNAVLVFLKKLAFTKDALTEWTRKSLCSSAQVISDGQGCFTGVTTVGGAASVKLQQFHAVNTLLSNLKTSFSGTYHAFDFDKYGQRYLAEVQYRFNRRFDLSAILARLTRAAALTAPYPERLIRAAEVGG